MDTSAGKSTTEEQKAKFRKEGRCYECERQGHMARDCPTKKPKIRKNEVVEQLQEQAPWSVKDMIARATKFSDEERLAFIQGLQGEEETETNDPGFLEA